MRLCRGTVTDYLERFGFKSDLVKAMYAVTDGFSGLDGGYDTPGTGMNFLVHNMCRLPGTGGTWMIVEGGMGTVTSRLAAKAAREGAVIVTGAKVARIESQGGAVTGVVLADGDDDRRQGRGRQRRSVPHARPGGREHRRRPTRSASTR